MTEPRLRPILKATDGRRTRWAEHRLTRRAELVEATIRAIQQHGAGVGMDEIAAQAGTSKTVLYRHFADKADLYLAVADSADRRILQDLKGTLEAAPPADPRAAIAATIDAYLRLVEADPDVYRFVVHRPLLDRPLPHDPVAGLTRQIGDQVARLLQAQLTRSGLPAAAAAAWGHGLVGLVQASADHWLSQPEPTPRTELARQLTDLIWGGLGAVLEPTEDR